MRLAKRLKSLTVPWRRRLLLLEVAVLGLSVRLAGAIDCPDPSLEVKAGICVPKNTNSEDSILGSKDLVGLIKNSINLLLYIAGAISVLFIIVGGYQYLTSGGNEEQAEKGRKTVTNALIGVVVVVLSYTIVNVLVGTLSK